MSTWKTVDVDVVDGVLLDPRNVRLDVASDVPQADIIHDLFKNEAALGLVDGIAKVGYLTHEVPIVLRRHRQLYVVEGNRRLAALKAIQNPHLAGDFQSKVSAICEVIVDRKALRTVSAKVAPNEDDAMRLIAALHTGNLRRPWRPERQAKFFQAQLDAGLTIQELKARYPTVDLSKFILRSRILELFKGTKYKDRTLSAFVDSGKFNVSTLARLYESKPFQDLTGIRLSDDENAALRLDVPRDCFRQMAEHIVSEMRSGRVDTRSVGTVNSDGFKKLMAELAAIKNGEVPAPTRPPTGDSETTASSDGAASGSSRGRSDEANQDDGTSSSPGRRKPPGKYLKVDQLRVPPKFPAAVGDLVREISRLDTTEFPNAAFDLMRTLLEKTIKAHADTSGMNIKRSGRNQDGYVFLQQCLEWLEDQFKASGNRALVQVVQKIRSDKVSDFAGSKKHLDAINHNHKMSATAEDVRNGWSAILPVLTELLPT